MRQTKVPGAAGVPGPETDPVSPAVVLVKTPRLQTMSALVAQLVGTISKEKIFHFILIRRLSTLEPLGSLSRKLSASLLTDPDQSVFGDLPGRCLESLGQLEFLQSFLWRIQVQVPVVYQGRLSIG